MFGYKKVTTYTDKKSTKILKLIILILSFHFYNI